MTPLALLTDEAAADLTAAFRRYDLRWKQADMREGFGHDLLGAAFTLCGLRYTEDRIVDYFRSLSVTLEDSVTYQYILKKGLNQGIYQGVSQGKLREAEDTIRRLGGKRFGPPSADAETRLTSVADYERLRRITDRILDAADWDDLLSTP